MPRQQKNDPSLKPLRRASLLHRLINDALKGVENVIKSESARLFQEGKEQEIWGRKAITASLTPWSPEHLDRLVSSYQEPGPDEPHIDPTKISTPDPASKTPEWKMHYSSPDPQGQHHTYEVVIRQIS